MTSFRQIAANRRNASKSTGPRTEEGKHRSRCNAVRHGLTAETVIDTLEDAEDYKAFEAAITADYDAQSAVERELVLRLAGLLWRLRRATTIEAGLFEIQVEHDGERHKGRPSCSDARAQIVYAHLANNQFNRIMMRQSLSATGELETAAPGKTRIAVRPANPSVDLAGFFCGSPTCRIVRSTA